MVNKLSRRNFMKSVSATVAASALTRAGEADAAEATSAADLKLWFKRPAGVWADALPIGNGRIGAMVFGGGEDGDPTGELLQMNDATLWSGRPRDGNNRHAAEYLPGVRQAVLRDHDYHAADALAQKMQGSHAEAYQPLGNLRIKFSGSGVVKNYRRELDLDTACARVAYTQGDARVEREIFASAADDVLVYRVRTREAGGLHCTITMDAELQRSVEAAGNTVVLTGKAPAHFVARNHPGGEHPLTFRDEAGEGMHYAVAARVLVDGGSVVAKGGSIEVQGANTVTIFVASRTGFKGFAASPDTPVATLKAAAMSAVEQSSEKPYRAIYQRHVRDHQRLFRRVSLALGASKAALLPTDERLAAFATEEDPSLIALYFQYGRYLLASCSRPGSQAANLQGMWNNLTLPPWGSNYTTNINVQMNYWPAETCNLSECAEPLFDFIQDLSVTGARTAAESYAAPGWCAHHNVDLWRSSNAAGDGVGSPTWGSWCMAGPWLCAHLYDHFLFSGDMKFLRERAYPVMRGAAQFCLAWLIDDGNGGLTTCPSVSTENDFLAPDGRPAMVSAGCTMDIALIRELFRNCQVAARLLRTDEAFATELTQAMVKLPPYKIGSHGQLQEWSVDFAESTPGQRHMSHLYPLFPGSEITVRHNAGLAQAARVSLERRLASGGAYTGWSRAWAINFWARLQDGDKAWESLAMLMKHSTNRNLFDTHPAEPAQIFQIDGNLGATAAVAEMLLQSHDGSLDLLPALPAAWDAGNVQGLRARGGCTVGMQWSRGRLQMCTLRPDHAGTFRVRTPQGRRLQTVRTGDGHDVRFIAADGLLEASLRGGQVYTLTFAHADSAPLTASMQGA